jgi:metal-responsive CopG/Arc/MetJ family transcriptional regulator
MTTYEETAVVGVTVPLSLLRKIDDAANADLQARAAWMRKAAIEKLRRDGFMDGDTQTNRKK